MKTALTMLLTCSAALSLTACGDPEPAGNDPAVDNMAMGDTATSDTLPTQNIVLSPEQQQRRAALDTASYQREVRQFEDADRAETGGQAVAAGTDTGSGASTGATGTPSPSPSSSAGAIGGRPMEMTFANLDRNDDGQLSVAEWAIYAVGLDPTEPKVNDQLRPYASAEQLNKAADGFFYYDQDGSTYLSQQEFDAAKAGTMRGTQ